MHQREKSVILQGCPETGAASAIHSEETLFRKEIRPEGSPGCAVGDSIP
jgi:hypothetical protein